MFCLVILGLNHSAHSSREAENAKEWSHFRFSLILETNLKKNEEIHQLFEMLLHLASLSLT